MRNIAKQAGVSIASVSRVLNNHPSVSDRLRDRVLASAQQVQHAPEAGRREASNIAYLYTGVSSVGSPFDSAVVEGLYEAMACSDHYLMVLDLRRTRRNGESYAQMFQRLGVCGAVLRTTRDSRPICEAIIEQGFPAVVVGDRVSDTPGRSVYCESRTASRDAVEHLVSLGHRRIAISLNTVDDSDHRDRLAGYRLALEEQGIAFDEKLVIRAPGDRQGGYQLIRRVFSAPDRPTAIYITDPMTAVGAICEAQEMGLGIPGDISIVGFDDARLRHTVRPRMTAVCQDALGLGREAYRVLSGLLKHKQVRESSPPFAWLEVHGSTGPLWEDPNSSAAQKCGSDAVAQTPIV
ncbi:MAG: LacI family DNA-binding transcriptional regulator [Phycisphaerales bacterium]